MSSLFKTGDRMDATNYRGLTVMNVFPKLYSTCLAHKLDAISQEMHLRAETQAGFRPGYRLEDHCLVLKTIFERCSYLRSSAYLLFIDLRKAYDTVHRPLLWDVLIEQLGLPQDIVSALKLMYCDLHV